MNNDPMHEIPRPPHEEYTTEDVCTFARDIINRAGIDNDAGDCRHASWTHENVLHTLLEIDLNDADKTTVYHLITQNHEAASPAIYRHYQIVPFLPVVCSIDSDGRVIDRSTNLEIVMEPLRSNRYVFEPKLSEEVEKRFLDIIGRLALDRD